MTEKRQMHEMGIANSILDAAGSIVRERPGCRVTKIVVLIGAFAGVNSESLQFCFEAMVTGTELAPLELEIERSTGDELLLKWMELENEVTDDADSPRDASPQ